MVEASAAQAELEAQAASAALAELAGLEASVVSVASVVSAELEAQAVSVALAEWFVSTEHIRLHCKLA